MNKDSEIIGHDLWGRPVFKRGRGRPAFEWTEENSRKVSMLLAMGWTNERIAGAVINPQTGKSISLSSLKRYFRAELKVRDQARDMLTAKRLMLALDAAENNNVGAMRLLDQLIEKNDRALADAMLGDRPPEKKPERLGKKEQSAEAARSAESDLNRELEEEAARANKH